MLVPRQEYSRELKMTAMREIDSGKGVAEVARIYQLSPKRLETWKGEWRAKGELAFPVKSARPQTRLDAERIAELERKIGQQTIEIDFLKKALRRFREHLLPAAGNGDASSMNKSGKRPKRGQP
jgi:transposase